jgi:hypothetical protein
MMKPWRGGGRCSGGEIGVVEHDGGGGVVGFPLTSARTTIGLSRVVGSPIARQSLDSMHRRLPLFL